MGNLNKYRHWYLYCKNWYKKTDIVEDLKVIQSHWSGIDKEYITEYDVLSLMLAIVWEHLKSRNDFFRFIDNALPGNVRFVGGTGKENHIKRTLLSIKSIIALTRTEDIDGELGEPDFSILPEKDNGY